MLQLEGSHYKVDTYNKYVEYLGWSFYTRHDCGSRRVVLRHRVRGRAHHLGAVAAGCHRPQYAGNNLFQASTAYVDRFYGIGN